MRYGILTLPLVMGHRESDKRGDETMNEGKRVLLYTYRRSGVETRVYALPTGEIDREHVRVVESPEEE